jgi:signal transduction histidine kinase
MMLRLSLSRRIALGYIGTIAIVLAVQGLVFLWLIGGGDATPDPDITPRLAAELSRSLEADPQLNLDERVSRLQPGEAVFVILRDGRVSSARKPPPKPVVQSVIDAFDRPVDEMVVRGWARSQYRGAPITNHGTVIGALGITPLTSLERFGPEVAVIGVGLLLLGTLISSILIVGPVRSRIQDLRSAASRLGAGDFTARARAAGHDEVAELARAFNAMADELERRAVALESSDRARRQLIADVSHELMTPLTAILGHLETLSMAEVRLDNENRLRHVAITTREAKRLERLIGDLLDMARLEAGGGDLDIQRVDIRDLFEQVVAHHEHDCRARNIRLVCSIQDTAETLHADPFRLEQALENVTANAIRYTPDGGTITLRAKHANGSIALSVTDEGEGIAPEHLPHIFDRFYKTASTKGIASRGSGLGLSIVKAVVARHGGRVSATSVVGAGTTIRLELPAAETYVGATFRSGETPELPPVRTRAEAETSGPHSFHDRSSCDPVVSRMRGWRKCGPDRPPAHFH